MNGCRNTGSGDDLEQDGGKTTVDAVFECLRHPRRRFILSYLREHEMATVEELARQVAAWEAGVPPDEVAEPHRERVTTALVHTHLPKLADEVFIEYDRRSNDVRFTDPPEMLRELLGIVSTFDDDADV